MLTNDQINEIQEKLNAMTEEEKREIYAIAVKFIKKPTTMCINTDSKDDN